VGALCAPRAFAAPLVTEPIRIDYRAETSCPSSDDFNAQVFRRTASARLATGGDTARTFIVVIERRGAGFVGSLVVQQTDGTTESREVAGPQCREVATVLALATALAIDPQASLAPSSTGTNASESPLGEPAPLQGEQPESHTRTDTSPDSGGDEAAEPSPSRPLDPWVLVLGPTLEGGVTPRLAYGASAGFGWRATGGSRAVSSVGVELTFLRAPAGTSDRATSSFQLVYARPGLCSVALRWDRVSGIAPCLGAEVGLLTGWGKNIPFAWTRSRVWAAIDMGLRLHQALGTTWFLEAEASVVLPITRYEFVFRDPTTHVFTIPSAAGTGGLRVGVRL
jgi:hypothetical protein